MTVVLVIAILLYEGTYIPYSGLKEPQPSTTMPLTFNENVTLLELHSILIVISNNPTLLHLTTLEKKVYNFSFITSEIHVSVEKLESTDYKKKNLNISNHTP